MDTIQLNHGAAIPQQGLGVFQVTDPAVCRECVLTALQIGYRLIDTAACYGNEAAVGAAVQESGIVREDLFLTSKVWIQDAGYDKTLRSFDRTLKNLGTDYLDLYLIHMPTETTTAAGGPWRNFFVLEESGPSGCVTSCPTGSAI